jgi:hypothetical protein
MAKKDTESTETAATETAQFVNPWVKGVNYKDFLEAIPKGVTPREYLTGKLGVANEAELITWLEGDLEHYTNSLKNK